MRTKGWVMARLRRGLPRLEFVYPALTCKMCGEQAVETVVCSSGEVIKPKKQSMKKRRVFWIFWRLFGMTSRVGRQFITCWMDCFIGSWRRLTVLLAFVRDVCSVDRYYEGRCRGRCHVDGCVLSMLADEDAVGFLRHSACFEGSTADLLGVCWYVFE